MTEGQSGPPRGPSLEDIRPDASVESEPDPRTGSLLHDLHGQRLELENLSLQDDIRNRRTYAKVVLWTYCLWMLAVGGILVLHGFGIGRFGLPENVLIALLGTTVLNVISLVLAIVKYTFTPIVNKGAFEPVKELRADR